MNHFRWCAAQVISLDAIFLAGLTLKLWTSYLQVIANLLDNFSGGCHGL